MQQKNKCESAHLVQVVQIICMLLIFATIVLFIFYFRDATVQDILEYTPENPIIAVFVLLLLYALKSLSVVFPIMVLYASAGALFPPFEAILVNVLGIMITVSCPYFVGRIYGNGLADRLVRKYPKARQLENIKTKNELFLTYLVKLIGIIPCDISSMLLGAFGIHYRNMLRGSVLGMAPAMIAVTILGTSIRKPSSPSFILSLGFTFVFPIISLLLYRKVFHRN